MAADPGIVELTDAELKEVRDHGCPGHDDCPICQKYTARLPFVLQCTDCEAGDDIQTAKQAEFLGWIGVERQLDGISYNDLGTCLQCQISERVKF